MKTLKITLLVILILICSLFAAPYLFKGKILQFAKKEINENILAKADFTDVSISFLSHFPKVTIALNAPVITGTDEFSADTLISARSIDVSVNFMSIIKGAQYKVYAINLEAPRIHAIVHKNGKANWSIAKPDTVQKKKEAEGRPFSMNLEQYAIHNGYIKYEDESSNMSSEIINLNHEGSGDFTSDLFTLKTKTSADHVNFRYGAIPYLTNAKASINADIQVDNKLNKYSFKTDNVLLNDLKLNVQGFFQFLNDSVYNMDIAYNAPSTDFKNILSLVPVIYQKDFSTIKTSGQAVFNGFVKGKYSATSIPAYNVNLQVKNGFFQYPDLPKPVKNINLALKIDNPDGVTDHTIVQIPQAHIEMANDPFDFRLLVKNPVSDMFIDAAAKGKMDLSGIPQFVKLESGTKLSGMLDADISVTGKVNAIEKQQFDQFDAKGIFNLNQFFYSSKSYPDGVRLNTLNAVFTPKNLTISNLSGQYLKTNFAAKGAINNIMPYVLKNKPLDGNITLQADNVNLNDWMGTTADTTTTTAANSKPFIVPNNLNLILNSHVDKVHYDKTDMQNLSGTLAIKDETVFLNNVNTDALDGHISMNGSYSTKNSKTRPDISLTYDVQNLDVQKTFLAFNTVQKLMPVAQYISGKISSHLTMNGKLGDNMMPDLSSLTGNGNLLLLQGFLKKFVPLDKLASTLNMHQLENVSLKDIKNYIEFANGKVLVKPFTTKIDQVEMEIGGLHGFDQSLDYTINMKVPRSMMGTEGNNLVNNLAAQASAKGVPVKLSDIVNLKVNLTGFIKNPTIKTDLKQSANSLAADMKQQALDFAKTKADSAKKAVRDTVTALKNKLVSDAKDELMSRISGKKDSSDTKKNVDVNEIKNNAVDAGKNILNGFFKKKTKDTASHH